MSGSTDSCFEDLCSMTNNKEINTKELSREICAPVGPQWAKLSWSWVWTMPRDFEGLSSHQMHWHIRIYRGSFASNHVSKWHQFTQAIINQYSRVWHFENQKGRQVWIYQNGLFFGIRLPSPSGIKPEGFIYVFLFPIYYTPSGRPYTTSSLGRICHNLGKW